MHSGHYLLLLHWRGWGRRVKGLISAWATQWNPSLKTKGITKSRIFSFTSCKVFCELPPLLASATLCLLSSSDGCSCSAHAFYLFSSALHSSLSLSSLLFHLSTHLPFLLCWPARYWSIGTRRNFCIYFDLRCSIDAYWGIHGLLEEGDGG